MPTLAIGRDLVMKRRALPRPSRVETLRNVPPEPDDLWDAIALQGRITEANKRLAAIRDPGVAVGLIAERRRDEGLLGVLLDRIHVDRGSFEQRLKDTPAVVYAVKLAPLDAEEEAGARGSSHDDDFTVSIYGRGFPFMDAIDMSGEFTTASGLARSFPLTRAGELADMVGIEFTAGMRPSEIGFSTDGVVTLVATMRMRNGTVVRRAVERFVVG